MKNQLAMGAIIALLIPFTSHAQVARESLLAAETAFADQAAKAGTAAAFLANSAPAALVAEGGKLADAQEVWTARPTKPGARLAWYPVLADVSQSGDLGYTTGPWTSFLNDRPQAAGDYVTVWRKQPDGTWKFAVDMGVERIGGAPVQGGSVLQPRLLAAAATPSAAPSNIILNVDLRFDAAELLNPGATYQQYLSAEARLYRSGVSTMQGATAAANMKSLEDGYLFTTTNGYLAASGDLGYVVGKLHRYSSLKHGEETGSYLRIWRREAVAGWRIALEVFNLTPSPATATAPTPAAPVGARAEGQAPAKRAQ